MSHEPHSAESSHEPRPNPDDPNMGTHRDDKFYTHSVPDQESSQHAPRGTNPAINPGAIGGGQAQRATEPVGTAGEDVTPHDMSSDLRNPNNDHHPEQGDHTSFRR